MNGGACWVRVLSRLADASLDWVDDFAAAAYLEQRLDQLGLLLKDKRLRPDYLHIRLVTDRVVPLGDGLEGWFLDFWLLFPFPERTLSHGLQIYVCPEGMEELPVPTKEGSAVYGSYDEGTSSGQIVLKGIRSELASLSRYECFVPDEVPTYQGRRWRRARPWNTWMRIRLRPGMRRDDVLAQLLLLALRQNLKSEEAHEWLVEYGKRAVPERAKRLVPAAVDHAVIHFLLPVGSLRWYISRVARGMAQEGQPPSMVQDVAARLEVSPRTVYRWRAEHPEHALSILAENLKEKRQKAELARYLAQKEGISYHAARMRIRRRLASGGSLEELAGDILSSS